MKRFYKDVTTDKAPEGWRILLDGKPVRTPARGALVLPTQHMADAIAQEWKAQGDEVLAMSMPLLRMANTVIDGISQTRSDVIGAILRFGEHDLLSYPAQEPTELVTRQQAAWGPMRDWAVAKYGASLAMGSGVSHAQQSPQTLDAFRSALAAQDDFALASLHVFASITGSLVLALALVEGQINVAQAFQLSRLDEDFQAERWGRDAEADARAHALAHEMDVAAAFLAAARA